MSVIKYMGQDYNGDNTTYTLSARTEEGNRIISLIPSEGAESEIVLPSSDIKMDDFMSDSSRNAVENKAIKTYVDSLTNVVNEGSYNLIPFPYKCDGSQSSAIVFPSELNGILLDYDKYGVITAKGTKLSDEKIVASFSTTDYIEPGLYRLSGCPKHNNTATYKLKTENKEDIGDGILFNVDVKTKCFVSLEIDAPQGESVDVKFKPMITKVNEDGYYPTAFIKGVAKSLDEAYANINHNKIRIDAVRNIIMNGSYNLISYYYQPRGITIDGVRFITNNDGSIIVNGKATADIIYDLTPAKILENDMLYFSSSNCSTEETDNMCFQVRASDGTMISWFKENQIFKAVHTKFYSASIRIKNGETVNNVVFKPMLVKVNPDGTFPTEYIRGSVMSNYELTDNKVDKVEGKGLSTNDYTTDDKNLVATIPDKANSNNPVFTGTVTIPAQSLDCSDGGSKEVYDGGVYFDSYGNMYKPNATASNYFAVGNDNNGSKSSSFKVYYSTGEIDSPTTHFKANETWKPTDTVCCVGFMTNSLRRIVFTVPLPKSMSRINNITITKFTSTIRQSQGSSAGGNNGYVGTPSNNGNWLTDANTTVTCVKGSDNTLHIRIDVPSGKDFTGKPSAQNVLVCAELTSSNFEVKFS